MNEQLDLLLKKCELADKKAYTLFHGLERLYRRSIMPHGLKITFPDLPLDFCTVATPLSRNSMCTFIQEKGHPLDTLEYYTYDTTLDRDNLSSDFQCTYGYFRDPNETVLRYLRKDLFKN